MKWMAKEAESIPNGMIVDWAKLNVFPDPSAMQHCEIESLRERYPRWWPKRFRRSWNEAARMEAEGATDFDNSVEQRFKAEAISNCGRMMKYQPKCLRKNSLFEAFYPEEKKQELTPAEEAKAR